VERVRWVCIHRWSDLLFASKDWRKRRENGMARSLRQPREEVRGWKVEVN